VEQRPDPVLLDRVPPAPSLPGFMVERAKSAALVCTFAESRLDEVDPHGFHADQHLPRPRLGNGQLGQVKNLRPACLVNLDGFISGSG